MYNKVMKKTVLVTIVSFLFLMLSSLVAWALRFADLKNCWLAWGIAAILLTMSIVVALVVRTRPKFSVINLVLNAVAMGFFIRAWYMFRGFDNSFLTMFFVCLACMAYLWVFYAICYIPFVERHFFAFFIGYFIVLALFIFVSVLAAVFTTEYVKSKMPESNKHKSSEQRIAELEKKIAELEKNQQSDSKSNAEVSQSESDFKNM